MIRRIGPIILGFLLFLSPSLVAAESGIAVIASDVDVDFPSQAVFPESPRQYVRCFTLRASGGSLSC